MNELRGFVWFKINGLNVLVITDHYKGSPILACEPDMILASRMIISKYRKEFKCDLSKVKIKYIEK